MEALGMESLESNSASQTPEVGERIRIRLHLIHAVRIHTVKNPRSGNSGQSKNWLGANAGFPESYNVSWP